jgi:hypothetical protein
MNTFATKKQARIFGPLLVLTLVFAFSSAALAADPYFSAGSGTAIEPFSLSSAEDLVTLTTITAWDGGLPSTDKSFYINAYYQLMSDIDMSGYTWRPIGESSGDRFLGVIYGNGKTISNLTATTSNGYHKGLFGWLGGRVYDVKLENVNFAGWPMGTTGGMGGVAGLLWTNGVIENVHVTGTLSTTDEYGRNVGGIVGVVGGQNARISNSSFDGNIVAEYSGNQFLGGIVGYINQSGPNLTVENCYSSGTITRPGTGMGNIGKIAGGSDNAAAWNSATFTNCYSTMNIAAASYGDYWSGNNGTEGTPPWINPTLTGLGVYYNDGAFAVKNANRLAVATLWLSASGTPTFTGANSFDVLNNETVEGGLQRVTLVYMVAGGEGFTAESGVILNIAGATDVDLVKARFVSYDENGNAVNVTPEIVKDNGDGSSGGGGIVPPVVPPVVPVNYDLNGDGKVDQLDLAIALKYFTTAEKVADFNNDEYVDIEDFILLLNNMTAWE